MRVSSPVRLTGLALVLSTTFSSLFAAPVLAQTPPMTPDIGARLVMPDVNDYVKRVVMIPMRDGVKLYTVIVVPKGAQKAPIMLTRTPYNAARRAQRAASPSMLATLPQGDDTLVENGYIRVFQDVRGKHGSEGDYVMTRPVRGPLRRTTPSPPAPQQSFREEPSACPNPSSPAGAKSSPARALSSRPTSACPGPRRPPWACST